MGTPLGLANANPIKLNATRPENWETISLPVMPKPYYEYETAQAAADSPNPIQESDSPSGRKFWKRLSLSRDKSPRKGPAKWTVKEIPRDVYMRHYAKDDDGKYVGTEQPADDCLLRRRSDVEKYRGGQGPVMEDDEGKQGAVEK